MSSQISYCCCGGEGGCFFGSNASSGIACTHNNKEELLFKIDRPAFMLERTKYDYSVDASGAPCTCAGTYVTAYGCNASPSIEVKYQHFQENDLSRTYTWYYTKTDLFPPCEDNCCGYNPDDANCCDFSSYPTGCSSSHYTPDNLRASQYQEQAIDSGVMPHLSSEPVAVDCQLGDQYHWLQGVSDRSRTEKYEHWVVSGTSVISATKRSLIETILCVVHKEKWWERYYNSLTLSDGEGGSSSDRAAAACRTMSHAIFACSGVFLCTWELKYSGLDAEFGSGTADSFILKVTAGDPVPEAWMDLLEEEGVLGPVKDWSQAGGEIIKKTLTYYKKKGGPFTDTFYGFGRPGGWTYVCEDWAAVEDWTLFPQIPRRYSVTCDFGGDDNCHTAAPIPGNDCLDCKVDTTHGDTPDPACTVCADPPVMGDCVPPVVSNCGDVTPELCTGDVLVGTCRGLWVQWWLYSLSKPAGSLTLNYQCVEQNNGYLCRVGYPPTTCDWDELPQTIAHNIPEEVSSSVRNATSSATYLCCGGEGVIDTSFPASGNCPASTPTGAACDEPDVWGPDI